MLPITLRPYEADDFEETIAVWRASKRGAFSYVGAQQRYTLDADASFFRTVIAIEYAIWIAEVAGRVAGFLAIKGDFINQLFVRVDVQRCGVGTALLQKAVQLSPSGLRLYTFQKNLRARRFYEKHNFRAERFGVSAPPENEPDIEYRWRP